MATRYIPTTTKTYATEANAVAAVNKAFTGEDNLRYMIVTNKDGRFVPVFLGQQALTAGVHFMGFTIVG
ncbi:hypothetical protein UFOVP605_38 [uncultured Caudovirales phage]|uniref:Uncharacterized protein n=1 Tax=uncultured Caudovirales phage TaxID=2100421 RepID=A0A6J5N773_9CAUD|nr:hypothetical protein UFOVP605_38 [uncultured Caudovirales phage]